ncbi:hypothetical protein LTR78_003558 [Recurvomyces mirabilis]|uniref:Uncharacterized protein n=1 Tax=Recurvomyces mirabilis TaxID=574656 RepID=A0AAE0WRN7_9PEZI|nr:hypothetical protein LTR78_003558 [Recurvomyces mirabilis]
MGGCDRTSILPLEKAAEVMQSFAEKAWEKRLLRRRYACAEEDRKGAEQVNVR